MINTESNKTLKIIQTAYQKLNAIKMQNVEPIAIIGMSCKFPQANSIINFWNLLKNNQSGISKVPQNRWNINKYSSINNKINTISSQYGGFIDNPYQFDAKFFDISPKEAISLDPQQRILLETCMEALENANQTLDNIYNSATSVYIGISSFDYGVKLHQVQDKINAYLGTSTLLSPAAGRISYTFGLKGPSMVIDTACSSSLVAIHQAIYNLRKHESNMSIVGGVGLLLEPNLSIAFSKSNMLSTDGICKTFDANANGYVRSEGCAVIILKRLSDAIQNKDTILGLILGSAVNQDGASGGLTIPSGPAQEEVILQALRNAKKTTNDIDYIETHGTGTPLGDPIEVNALGNVFANKKTKLKIGSVKTNIGHLEAVSGLASLIKVILSLQHKIIPANLHFSTPNPNIHWNSIPIEVIHQNTKWNKNNRIAGISSFGFSGTNAHIIVSEYLNQDHINVINNTQHNILTLSAKSSVGLKKHLQHFKKFLQNNNQKIDNICYTSNSCRTHFNYKIAFNATNIATLIQKITTYINNNIKQDNTENKKITFIFSIETESNLQLIYNELIKYSFFKKCITNCINVILSNKKIYKNINLNFINNITSQDIISYHFYIFAIQYSISMLFQHWGIKPKFITGYGIGEFTAYCVCGIFSLENIIHIIYQRALLIVQHNKHYTIFNIKYNTLKFIQQTNNIIINSINTQQHTANVSVQNNFINEFKTILNKNNSTYTQSKLLNILHLPKEEHQSIQKQLQNFTKFPNKTKLIYLQNTTQYFNKDHYYLINVDNQTQDTQNTINIFFLINDNNINYSMLSIKNIYNIIIDLFTQNVNINWNKFHEDNSFNKIELPHYTWQKEIYMFEDKRKTMLKHIEHELIHNKINSPILNNRLIFESHIDINELSFLKDHIVFNQIIFPESCYIEMLIATQNIISKHFNIRSTLYVLHNITLLQPCILNNAIQKITFQTIITINQNNTYKIQIFSLSKNDTWIEHIYCYFSEQTQFTPIQKINLSTIQNTPNEKIDTTTLYKTFHKNGVQYGSTFQGIQKLYKLKSQQEILSYIKNQYNTTNSKYYIHPLIIDNCLQSINPIINEHTSQETYFLFNIDKIQYFAQETKAAWCYIKQNKNQNNQLKSFDLYILNEKQNVLLYCQNLKIKFANKHQLIKSKNYNWYYNINWIKNLTDKTHNNISQYLIENKKTWLIIGYNNQHNQQIVKLLNQNIQNTINIVFNTKNQQITNNNIYIPHDNYNELNEYVTKIQNTNIQHIIYVCSIEEENNNEITNTSINYISNLINLIKIITQKKIKTQISIITNNAQYLNNKYYNTSQATLWGIIKVLRLESPELKPKIIDIEYLSHENILNIISESIFNFNENQIIFRQNTRYVARLQYNNKLINTITNKFLPSENYLITGAFGALGIETIKFLISQGAKNFILISRSGAKTEEAHQLLKQLQNLNIKYTTYNLDIADSTNIMQIKNNQNIKGVIHTAGVIDDGIIYEQTKERFIKVLKPKIQGTINLHKLTLHNKLKFFICFSSMTSVIGNISQSNYAAANAFMDFFAYYRQSLGLNSISISWGPWKSAGMAAKLALNTRWTRMGITPITINEGMKILNQLINNNIAHIGVMPTNWDIYPDINNFFNNVKTPQNTTNIKQPNNILDEIKKEKTIVQQKKKLRLYIESQIRKILEYKDNESFEINQGFFELGMNSLTSIELKNNLQQDLDFELPSTIAFDYPTIKKLIEYLHKELFPQNQDISNLKNDHQKQNTEKDKSIDSLINELSNQLNLD